MSRLLLGFQRRFHTQAAKLEKEGDYMGAAKALEEIVDKAEVEKDDVEKIGDSAYVRSRVKYLTRASEMKWRFKIVDKGESP